MPVSHKVPDTMCQALQLVLAVKQAMKAAHTVHYLATGAAVCAWHAHACCTVAALLWGSRKCVSDAPGLPAAWTAQHHHHPAASPTLPVSTRGS